MADDSNYGTPWSDRELDLIVADYFAMLKNELAGIPYVKAQHRRALAVLIGRTEGSIEFKHQNISAVLEELGMERIVGYMPAANYQAAIFDAIDRYLSAQQYPLNIAPAKFELAEEPAIFTAAPSLQPPRPRPPGLERLVRKFDPVMRDFQNRTLGRAGEEFVLELERRTLTDIGRADLAKKVRWVSAEDGDGAGYDIQSFDPHGKDRLIEVKTTNGPDRTPFFLTRNEYDVAAERSDVWHLYRVHRFAQKPGIFTVRPPLETALHLRTEVWRATPGNS